MGGNVFAGETTSILKENIKPTLDKFFDELSRVFPKQNLSPENFHPVGSTGKKPVSGDIDLAIDNSVFFQDNFIKEEDLENWDIQFLEFWTQYKIFRKRARTATVFQIKQRTFNLFLSKTINSKSDSICIDEKKVTAGNIFCMFPQYDTSGNPLGVNIQIDINLGNLDWLKFAYYSGELKGNVKGLHRTQLILALFAEKGYIFSHAFGVKEKETNEIVATTPNLAIHLLSVEYKAGFTSHNINNYYDIMEIISCLPECNNILDRYLKILDSTRCDIPDDLQEYWKENKTRLKLHGGYLPEDSSLIPYRR